MKQEFPRIALRDLSLFNACLPRLRRKPFSLGPAVLTLIALAACGVLICSILRGGFPSKDSHSNDPHSVSDEQASVSFSVPATTSAGIHTVDTGDGLLKLQDGREFSSIYHGSETSRKFVQSGEFRPLSLASSDLNQDGYIDLIGGYKTPNGGALVLRQANREAFAPEEQRNLEGIKKSEYIDPFVADARVVDVPEAPDFLATGDFTQDGNPDVLVAARGSNGLFILAGDGHGQLSSPQRLALPGQVTALVTGNVNSDGELTGVVVGTDAPTGSSLLVYDGKKSLLESAPTIHPLSAPATMLALGRLDDDTFTDLAIVVGGQLNILHGSAERLATDVLPAARQAGMLEAVPLPFSVKAIAAGEFVWDRESRTEIAVMSTDGSVHIAARGKLDTRPVHVDEIQKARRLMAEVRDGKRPMADIVAVEKTRAVGTERWHVVEDVSGADVVTANDSTPPLLLTTRMSAQPADDLLVMNHASRQIVVNRDHSTNNSEMLSRNVVHSSLTLQAEQQPVAALPMRLNVDGRPGLIVLSKGSIAPSIMMPLAATTFTVTRADDPAPNGCAVGDCSLREAVIAANANAGADTIVFNAGINPTLTITSGGGTENNAATGDLDVSDSVTITGNNQTIISTTYTSTCGDCKVFGVNQLGNPGVANPLTVSFSGVTIQNGFNNGAAFAGTFFETGGGIDFFLTNTGNSYSMTNCVVTNNQVTGSSLSHGAGINVDSAFQAVAGGASAGTVTLTNVTVSNNTSSTFGAGIVLAADKHDVNMTNCVVTGNSTTGLDGAGVWIRHSFGGTVTISGASGSVSNNTAATNGGGFTIAGNQVTNISNITISNNTATGTGGSSLGGGVLIDTLGASGVTGSTTLTNVIISNNHANNGANAAGGGVRYGGFYVATMSGCTVSGNTSKNGAGVVNSGSTQTPAPTLAISGGSFTGNAATGDGGAFASTGTGSPTASVTTFSNVAIGGTGVGQPNTAVNGGGIAATQTGSISVTNNSIAGNSATTSGGGVFISGGSLTLDGVTIDSNSATSGDGLHQSAGTFTGANTINFNGGDSVNLVGGTFNSTPGTLNLTGNFTNSGGSFVHNSGTFIFNGTGAQSLGGTTSSTFNNLTVNKGSGTLTLGVNTTLANVAGGGNLSISGGVFDLSTFTINRTASGGTMTVSNGTTLKIGGANTLPSNYSAHSIGATSTIEYAGASQNVATLNSAQKYGNLLTSGSGTKTLAGNISVATLLSIGSATTLDVSASNFSINDAGNWTNNGTFAPRSGTVTFDGSSGTQTLAGNTTFFNLTIANAGATIAFGSTNTTVGNTLSRTSGTSMDPGTGTFTFTGGAGSITGASAKVFNNVVINSGASISNTTGGNSTIQKDFTNNGTFTQGAGITTTFDATNATHNFAGSGTTTFGVVSINSSTTVDAGSHNFNVVGATFTVTGTFTGNTSTATFNGGVAQQITGNGTKNFSGLTINNGNGVTLNNGSGAVDASVSGLLTLTTDLTVAASAILQQSGTSGGAGDVVGTVRRTDLGTPNGTARSFGNVDNAITINSGTAPNPMDVTLAKGAGNPTGFPGTVLAIQRTYGLAPTGGSGISATVKLRYLQSEVGSATESRFILWKDVTPWTPQGGAVDTVNNFVSLAGVSSFSNWAIAEGSDLTLTKANNVSGAAVTGQAWNWTLTATNAGAPATFTAGQTILSDNLPNSNLNYGTPTVQNVSNITGNANISCSITSNDLTCTASGGSVTFDSNLGVSKFDVVFSATPQTVGSYQNPRTGGGVAQVDPNNVIVESNEGNNTPTNNTVTVSAAGTTTTITNAASLTTASVTGQPVTVQWNVTVNAPGSLGTALTGNVNVSDGTNQCVAAVSAGQCDITFTTAGAKNITATYAGDSNYSGSASTPATPHTVNAANTTTTITEDNPDPSTLGQSVTVKWTVTVNSPGAGTPTGNVNVTVSGGAETCSAAVATGQCSLALNATGNRTITATYVGDSNFNTSNDTESHDVCPATLVTTNADSGAGSLRDVITNACDGATITFDIAGAGPHTITLTTGELALAKNLTIDNSSGESITVSGNNASRVFNINSGKTVAIRDLTVTGGLVSGGSGNGGGILNDHGTLTLNNMTISGNTADFGGGVYNNGATSGTATLTVTNSTLSGNTANLDGAAIFTDGNNGNSVLTINNSTISGNSAKRNGGGINDILAGAGASSVTTTNATFTANHCDSDNDTAGRGGAMQMLGGTYRLRNTIVAGNFQGSGTSTPDDITFSIDTANSFNNVMGNGGNGGVTDGVNGNHIVVNAFIGPLANNGGPTQTHALLFTSPAVDAGDNTFANAVGLLTDQRGTGFPRIADSADADTTQTVDIGAFELHPSIENIPDKTTAEDTPLSFSFNIGDATGALITSVAATSGNTTLVPNLPANISVTGSGATRTLTITPAANANSPSDGTSTITVTVTATNGQTAQDTFVLTVTEVNDNPDAINDSLTAVDEDSGPRTIPFTDLLGNDTKGAANESSQSLTVTGVSNPFGGTATLDTPNSQVLFTPAADFNGTAHFDYTITDNGTTNAVSDPKGDTATASFTVNAVNDEPSFTKGPDQIVPANSGAHTVNNWATNISAGPPDESAQILTFNLTNNNNALFTVQPAVSSTGTLTYTVANGQSGTANVDITLTDNGSNVPPNDNTSPTQTFTITVGAPSVSVHDAKVAEPTSGTANMLFTVSLNTPAVGTITVNFNTVDGTAKDGVGEANQDYTGTSGTVTFTSGQQVQTISVPVLADADNSEVDETFQVTLSGPSGATINNGTATGTITVANTAGTFLISELRTSGPGGLGDDFVELYNNTDSPLTVAASDASAGYGLYKIGATCNDTPVLIATIPNGTVIPARGHYLVVGSQYSLANYGGTGAAAGNLTMTSDIESDRNVAVFSTADINNLSSAARLDAVGFGANTGAVCDLLREGNNLGAVSGSTTEHSFFRKECDFVGGVGCTTPGNPKDTNNNATDFMFADTQGTFISGVPQRLGAPGPENLASPLRRDSTVGVTLLDNTKVQSVVPNRVRDLTGGPPATSTFGTLSIRRRVQNNTGGNVTRLRFRIVEITTFPSPGGGTADVRPITSANVSVSAINDPNTCFAGTGSATTPCTVTVKGTTLETPPSQPNGGGFNSTMADGTITLGTPLAPGASTMVQFMLGVQTTGSFRFLIIVEALP